VSRATGVHPAAIKDAAILGGHNGQRAPAKGKNAKSPGKLRPSLLACGALLAAAGTVPAVEHPADGPRVDHVCAVAPDVLMVTIQSGFHVPGTRDPYVAQAGDVVIEEGKDDPDSPAYRTPVVLDGKPAYNFVLKLKRDGEVIGTLSPDRKHLLRGPWTRGALLNADAAGLPSSFRIHSAADKAYAAAKAPLAVHRKCKPDAPGAADDRGVLTFPFLHQVALKLPSPLKEGAAYTLVFTGLNTARETVVYVHDPRRTRSDAVHVTQVGYCPDDGCKRAYLSMWLGADASGIGQDVDYSVHKIGSFELIDAATGKTVHAGKATQTKKRGDIDAMGGTDKCPDLDLSLAPVWRLDFSGFTRPAPFRIAADVYEVPFRAAMHSILCQRSGIELKAPYAEWNRPRNFREEDGVQFYQISLLNEDQGQEGARGEDMLRLFAEGKLERVHGIWGAHEDAGDWDTLTHHLAVPFLMFELYDMFPGYFARFRLPLPPEEERSRIPAILADAVWLLDGFKRLQGADGGVRGGYGDPWGQGENFSNLASWDAKCVLVYAENPGTSYFYAACAARAARVLAAIDPGKAAGYRESALRAWEWAEKKTGDSEAMQGFLARYGPHVKGMPWDYRVGRVRAVVELHWLTRDPRYAAEMNKDSIVLITQPELLFAYARAPEELWSAGRSLKRQAVEMLIGWADAEIAHSRSNGFEICTGRTSRQPLNSGNSQQSLLSTPGGGGGVNMARVAYLTKAPRHIAAVVQSCNYCFGANPMNFSYMAGVGWNSYRFPFKVDRRGGRLAPGQPRGYIPFGFQAWASWWAIAWVNGKWNPDGPRMFPDFEQWPFQERFLDWSLDPCMNECVVDVNQLAAAYNTGFLMAREALGGKW
jgi:endoglucanase